YERVTRRDPPAAPLLKRISVALLLVAAASALGLDAAIPSDIYEPVHLALRVTSLIGLPLAVSCFVRALPTPLASRGVLVVLSTTVVALAAPWAEPTAAGV